MKGSSQFGLTDKIVYFFGSSLVVISTVLLFLYLNRIQPTYYIDEIFHIPQTIRYCEGRYHEWDQKITTLPALYFITSQVLKLFDLCNITYIRSTNLISTFLNLYLINCITKHLHNVNNQSPRRKKWIQIAMTYNIAFLPPLFFWFFLYYTDVFSVSMILCMVLLHVKGYVNLASIPGIIAILVRQTNIIWMALLAGEHCLDKIDRQSKSILRNTEYANASASKRIWNFLVLKFFQGPLQFGKLIFDLISAIWMYVLCGISFVAFIIYNEGIVVGDRESHKPTVHLPQIFYFSAFSMLFAWPYMIIWLKSFCNDIRKHLLVSSFIFAGIVIVIHNNTLVHKFVLADNRHYVFYLWSKFMNRNIYFKYLLAPVYGYTMYAFYKCISHVNVIKIMLYLCCISLVLVPQLLLEPRYFIIPYIFFRLNLRLPQTWQVILECLTMFVINVGQFWLFANKTFYWKDLSDPQRMSW